MQSRDIVGLIAIVGVFGVPIIAIICHYVHASLKSWQEIALKRDMVARGYTAAEIMGVIANVDCKSSDAKLPNVPPAKPVKQPAYSP
jgi:hypothetical protein